MTARPVVYVLHFDKPLHHARHYIGIALDGDAERRFAGHLAGQSYTQNLWIADGVKSAAYPPGCSKTSGG